MSTVTELDPSDFTFTRRTWIDADPVDVYRLVSDVAAISRWSPNASDVAFDEGSGPEAGAWFSGRNRRDGKEWTTRSQVVKAEPGAVFAFVVDGIVEWTWTFEAHDRGTAAEQSWRLLRMDPVLGGTRADVEALRDYMAASAETTLTALADWVTRNPPARRAPRQD
ncbi:SRPBCC family protein [Lentzea sp. NBC_00516]|uniref:SRPBCC family protein n=1 Tax=Lentzea sp. NBC_00516 TaxID=2903582 RepID=UPI002E804ACD|nr:SRPBCC family protein [Lentzea sp. NBC_00516]WUD26781.1 SRPBCC family protein [Lentzea sp. NBC_00516]